MFPTHCVEHFYHKWALTFVERFFCICREGPILFTLHFVSVLHPTDGLVVVEPPWHPSPNSRLIVVYDSVNVLLLNLVGDILLRMFASMFVRSHC